VALDISFYKAVIENGNSKDGDWVLVGISGHSGQELAPESIANFQK